MSLTLSPQLLASPDTALLAVIAGILLLYAEFNLPGTVLPGCIGVFFLMLGLFALSHMPLRPAAVASVLGGFALLFVAILTTRALLLAALGGITLAGSFLNLVNPAHTGATIDLPAAVLGAFVFSAATVWLGRIALRARRNKQIPSRASAPLAE